MRSFVILLVLAVAAAEFSEEPWVEEEDVDEPYDVEEEEVVYRRRRDVHDEDPYEEHIRVKRCCEEPRRVRRSADYVRTPRQVHNYEVHEFTDDADTEPSSPPYEEMLASASDHYHKVYASPGAPRSARYLEPDVSSTVNTFQNHNHQIDPPDYNYANAPVQSTFQPLQKAASEHVQTLQKHQAQLNKPVQAGFKQSQAAPIKNLPIHSVSPSQFAHSPEVHAGVYVSPPAEVPVPVAADPVVPLQRLDGDQIVAAGHHHHNKHAHGHKQGGGHANHAQHYGQHGGKVSLVFVCSLYMCRFCMLRISKNNVCISMGYAFLYQVIC